MTTLETILHYPQADYQYAHKLAPVGTPTLTAQIIGIDFQDRNEPIHVFCETKHLGNRRTWTSPDCLTPVLFGFDQLCTPLADGTAIAVAMMREMGTRCDSCRMRADGAIVVYNDAAPGMAANVIYPDLGIGLGALTLDWAKVCYKYHVAVGLTADQYIRKQA